MVKQLKLWQRLGCSQGQVCLRHSETSWGMSPYEITHLLKNRLIKLSLHLASLSNICIYVCICIYCIYFTDWIRLRYRTSYNLINHSIPVYSCVARKECVVVGCLSLGSVRDKSHFDFRELQSDPYEEIYSFIWEEFHERTSLWNGLLAGRRQSCFRFPIPSHHPTIPPSHHTAPENVVRGGRIRTSTAHLAPVSWRQQRVLDGPGELRIHWRPGAIFDTMIFQTARQLSKNVKRGRDSRLSWRRCFVGLCSRWWPWC